MNYLFFDAECSNGTNICSFGYCLTDENFNIIRSEDIVINPMARFQLGRFKGEPQISLKYSPQQFASAPTFDKLYPNISALFKDAIIIGHALSSDALFLNNACLRYKLRFIDFDYYDTQLLYKSYTKTKEVKSLGVIANELGLDYDANLAHRSDFDALTTLNILKELLVRSGLQAKELLNAHACRGTNKRGNIFVNGKMLKSSLSYKKKIQKQKSNAKPKKNV